jgi:hypothetical protein
MGFMVSKYAVFNVDFKNIIFWDPCIVLDPAKNDLSLEGHLTKNFFFAVIGTSKILHGSTEINNTFHFVET